jgi:Na+-driven multidrug efflux pump
MPFTTGHEASASPGLLDSAVDYVNIRAWSMPTTLLSGAIQAALLGAKDSVTPLIAILYSTIANVIGDYILVSRYQMGLRGAAIATLIAQLISTWCLLGPARRRLLRDHNFGLIKKRPPTEDSVTGQAFLAFAAPVLTLILGKLAAFGFMTHSAAAVPGQPIPLASHQIILSLFFFVSPFMEVISQTAQTFLPPYLAPLTDYIAKRKEASKAYDPSKDASAVAWQTAGYNVATNLLKVGFGMAAVVATLASLIPAKFGNTITTDKAVQEAAKPLAKYLFAGAFLTAPVAVSEGVLLARRELKFLASIYLVSTILLPAALLQVKFSSAGTVDQVWLCFAVFQLFRALCFGSKIWSRQVVKRIAGAFSSDSKTAKQKGGLGAK